MRNPFAILLALVALLVSGLYVGDASAFCGFYVSGADAKLFNNATQVVLLRDGTRTVLSMQNDYRGPPQSFAMVIPVPVVLQKENVKTLPKDIFEKVDKLGAPRLVEEGVDYRDAMRVEAAPNPPVQHGAAHLAGADEKQGLGALQHQASPCVSKSTAASASSGVLPAQMTNWKAWK